MSGTPKSPTAATFPRALVNLRCSPCVCVHVLRCYLYIYEVYIYRYVAAFSYLFMYNVFSHIYLFQLYPFFVLIQTCFYVVMCSVYLLACVICVYKDKYLYIYIYIYIFSYAVFLCFLCVYTYVSMCICTAFWYPNMGMSFNKRPFNRLTLEGQNFSNSSS